MNIDTLILSEPESDNKTNIKNEISDLLLNDKNFKKIINVFKNTKTRGIILNNDIEGMNGLSSKFFVCINNDNELVKCVIPIFSTTKTITWSSKYLDSVIETLESNSIFFNDEELTSNILITLFIYDQELNDYAFIQVSELVDFIRTGITGKNSYGNNINKYKWLSSLPDITALTLENIRNNYFNMNLHNMSDTELKQYCEAYAILNYDKFNNKNNRGQATIVSNISNGIFIELKHQIYLTNKFGQNVSVKPKDSDDYGVDMTLNINKMNINIDVKSTKSTNLSISSNREATDCYAVYNNNSKYKEPKFLGYILKSKFWTNDVKEHNGMYLRSLESLKPFFITDEYELVLELKKERLKKFNNNI